MPGCPNAMEVDQSLFRQIVVAWKSTDENHLSKWQFKNICCNFQLYELVGGGFGLIESVEIPVNGCEYIELFDFKKAAELNPNLGT